MSDATVIEYKADVEPRKQEIIAGSICIDRRDVDKNGCKI